MKVALLTGAGISYGCGLPTVEVLTQSLFEEEWHNHTDECFYPGIHPNPYYQKENLVYRIKPFLRILYNYAEKYLGNRNLGKPTYEDLFYLAAQISDEVSGMIINPAISLFFDAVNKQANNLYKPLGVGHRALTLRYLSEKTTHYIQDVVQNKLSTNAVPENLDLILEMASDEAITRLDIYTLNHDLLIENLFAQNEIEYADCFDKPTGDIRRYNSSTYDSEVKVKLYKLHGSINWYMFMNQKIEQPLSYIGMPTINDVNHCKDSNGNLITNISGRPYFLTGTYNKIFDYDLGLYAEILTRFQNSIEEHDKLIVSGYGWKDQSINRRILRWIYSNDNRKIICLHKDFLQELENKSAINMLVRHKDLIDLNQSIIIDEWLSEISISDISKYLK
ncbi:MAG: hypothetical protein FVQ81_14240 [Candidatus Glassbacteria bacterium]|nr:hypothetical protein [Candidatus Glassbacteria bacterium]